VKEVGAVVEPFEDPPARDGLVPGVPLSDERRQHVEGPRRLHVDHAAPDARRKTTTVDGRRLVAQLHRPTAASMVVVVVVVVAAHWQPRPTATHARLTHVLHATTLQPSTN